MGSSTSTTRRGGAVSRHGGVPTVVPPPAGSPGQLALPLAGRDGGTGPAGAPARAEPLPGAVHLPGWLDPATQRHLAEQFRLWARPPAGLRHPRVPTGQVMSVQSVCLGWHWRPYAYSRTADDTDGAPVKPLPADLAELARAAVAAAYRSDSPAACSYAPDAAIVNLYAPGARLGLHQDGEEPSAAPVVTFSLGDTCRFRFAGVDRRTGPFTDIDLASGDLLVFGGPSRLVFHGVPKVYDATGPIGLGLPPGRLSITVRETGLG
jgi:alkylated DNA repair protein (DNA oxidative demethylase)